MHIHRLGNAVEVQGVNLLDDDECTELGRVLANECVVLVKDSVSEKRLFEIQNLWGQPCRPLVPRLMNEKKLSGRHWRDVLMNMAYIRSDHKTEGESELSTYATRISYERDEKGRTRGFFSNGELDWHCDQHAFHDNQRIVGLMSLWGTENSQTTFLCTADTYANLNHEDRSMVDELVSVYEWDGGTMCQGLIPQQLAMVQLQMVPLAKMECPLHDRTASGVHGIRFPSQCFTHFKDVSPTESLKIKDHIWSLLNTDKNIYRHHWQDGEIMFMDQNITLHARPTNIEYGNKRTLCRISSYLDNLFPGEGPIDYVKADGEDLSLDEFAIRLDRQRRAEYEKALVAS